MRFVFVHHVVEDRGSAQDIYNYAKVAEALGHEVALYGPTNDRSAFSYSLDVGSNDALILIFEWTTDLQRGDILDLVRLVGKVPRKRRVVIDCDGKYNDAISVVGDYNHPDETASRRWVETCDSLADKICQPTFHPLRPNVRPFLFHAYSPAWEVPLDSSGKDYGMYYVGNNWFRWRPMQRLLTALEPIREQVGRLVLVGHGWDSLAPWANPSIIEDAYQTDPAYLERLDIEVRRPIRFDRVIEGMSRGVFTPVIYRPLFDHLRLVTCRTFETPAANTIPLFAQDPAYVEEIYGDRALELILPEQEPQEKILDVLRRPEHYAGIVADIRRHLAKHHSYAARLRQLIEIVEA
jgi:glycosyltransferase involved in cell wall biosynthesis